MLRIDKSEKKLVRLAESALADSAHWERDLQTMICANPDSFCEEIGESLRVIGQEVRPLDTIADRIDILAVDERGHTVVIELKRGSSKLQLLQAVSYAGMVRRWSADDFIRTLASSFQHSPDDARTAIEDHIGSEISSINQEQRILLIAEDFDPALLIAAEWLHEIYSVDIRCFRLQLSQENGCDYLTCTCIYPPIEIAELTRRSANRPAQTSTAWADWDSALEAVENPAVREFFRAELGRQQESRLPYRELIYRVDGKRRFWVSCRRKYAYVWQWGRFETDEAYWRQRLSEPDHVQRVQENRSVRFHLSSVDDFAAFSDALKTEIPRVGFNEGGDLEDSVPEHELTP